MGNTLWKWMGKLCSLTPFTKRVSLAAFYQFKKGQYRYQYARREAVKNHMVVFEAYMGKKYACSPRAIYEAMCQDPAYDDWEKIWAFCDPEAYGFLEERPKTRVVAYRKAAYYRAFAQAKYWVTNSRLPRELEPKTEQRYIQCWHGTPLKKLGFDLTHYTEREGDLREVQENYGEEARRLTCLPSPSPFYTEKMTSAFGLKKYGKEKAFLEAGYPRNDRLFTYTKEEVEAIRKRLQLPLDKKVILYAPTWRENQHVPGEGYTYRLHLDFPALRKQLGQEYVILFRAHYFISSQYDFSSLRGFVYDVSGEDDVNDLYLVADMLITDYSSVFFDYANLKRPILFYMYDYDVYKNEMRDFYLHPEELPGPQVRTQEELLEKIRDIKTVRSEYRRIYERFNKRFNPHDNPCSAVYLKQWFLVS